MLSPKELKEITEQGLVQKKIREEKEHLEMFARQKRKDDDRKMKEKNEASHTIDNAQYLLENAAKLGNDSVILCRIPYDDLSIKDRHNREQSNFICRGATKIVFDHFRENDFAVSIHVEDGPYDPEGPTPDAYYIKVSW
jgi:hypothetical protein